MDHTITVSDRDPLLEVEAQCPCGWTETRSGSGCRAEIDELVKAHILSHSD